MIARLNQKIIVQVQTYLVKKSKLLRYFPTNVNLKCSLVFITWSF